MNDVYFCGLWRMDWGLGNPNKTAALIVMLMLASWALAFSRKQGFLMAAVLFTALGICLVHTASRGGVVSLILAGAFLLMFLPRPRPLRRVLGVTGAIFTLLVGSVYLGVDERYIQGMASEDRSITNRIDLWKAVPMMMSDAPSGWGWGKSGEAYMQWYQPLDRNETYRTLVNSHFTWLVEFGWVGRFCYILLWLVAFVICWPQKAARWMAVSFSIWVSFACTAFFSSVAETPFLWIIPLLALAACMACRLRNRLWPVPGTWAILAEFSVTICGVLWFLGQTRGILYVEGARDSVKLGKEPTSVWIVPDIKTTGRFYGKTLRRYISDMKADVGIRVVLSSELIPYNIKGNIIAIAGFRDAKDVERLKRLSKSNEVILLAPAISSEFFLLSEREKIKNFSVVFGEFSQSPLQTPWKRSAEAKLVMGAGDYLPEWPQLVFQGKVH